MKYTGGCHCGKVRYEVEMNLEKGLACNCSICLRKGTLLDFVPAAQFKLLSDEGELQDYLFNKKVIHHLFCKTCGVSSFARAVIPSGEMVAINVRCIDGVDVSKLKINEYDGASV